MIRIAAAVIAAFAMCAAAGAEPRVSYFPVPAGAHPHDVAAAPDGNVWYTAQSQGALGILDPKTGKVEQMPLGKGAAPHGVIAGPDGAAWITEAGQNAIARFDPKSKEVRLFPLPKGFENANLNTAAFDRDGILWFTGQKGVYGRVDPASGRVDAWKAPKGYGPYGIASTPAGEVWYASLAGDHIARIDTATGAATVVDPPRPASARAASGRTPRASCGSACGTRARSAATIRFRTHGTPIPLPKSKSGCYSVYVDEQDKVWVTDFVANAILRFDPVD